MPRTVVVCCSGLTLCAAALVANKWFDNKWFAPFGVEDSNSLAALAALPMLVAIILYVQYPAPGRGVGKAAPPLGAIKKVGAIALPFSSAGALQPGHGYCIVFWMSSMPQCLQRIESVCRVCAASSDLLHFVMVSADEPSELIRFTSMKMRMKGQGLKPLTLTFAADASGEAMDNYMHGFGERGVPHAFVVGTDGVITWHGHPNRPDLIEHLRAVMVSLPEKPAPAAAAPGAAASKPGPAAAVAGASAESKKNA